MKAHESHVDVRLSMARLPRFLQPFLTALTRKPLPGERPLVRFNWLGRGLMAVAALVSGLAVGAWGLATSAPPVTPTRGSSSTPSASTRAARRAGTGATWRGPSCRRASTWRASATACARTFLDGVDRCTGPVEPPEFLPAPEVQPDEVARVHRDAMRRINRALQRAGRADLVRSEESIDEASGEDSLDTSESLFPLLQAASVQDRVALGPDSGRPIPRLRDPSIDVRPASQGLPDPASQIAEGQEFSLHAATRVDAGDHERLEALTRYVARPALARGRLEVRGDGKVKWTLRQPWRDGTRAFVFGPVTFLERLTALVPNPREHGWTYHGSLAPASTLLERIVPRRPVHPSSAPGAPTGCELASRRRSWAELLERTFAEDVLRCPRCGGRRHHIATITDPFAAREILRHIGARSEPLILAPARPPPQAVMRFG